MFGSDCMHITVAEEGFMARQIVLSNGELHVGINKFGLVHDLYFPYVGLENHVAGKSLRHKIGVHVDGQVSWLDDDAGWNFQFSYPTNTLIGHTVASNDRIGVVLEFDDAVDADQNALLRNINVVNQRDDEREIKLYMYQVFAIGDSRSNTDTAQYLPESQAILHYRGRRAFVISGKVDQEQAAFDQYTVGLFGIENHEGSFRDADDGHLESCNIEHGRVDSVIGFSLKIMPQSSKRVQYWIAAGTSMDQALKVHNKIKTDGMTERLHQTADFWKGWIAPAEEISKGLPVEHQNQFLRSILIIKSQIDKRGAVIASTDSTMLNYSRDAYAYCWPRDGSLVLWPLIRMGYKDEPLRYFEFCRRVLHKDGYLQHKFRADGALGSSWHPYVQNGRPALPIQEDETALTLFVFGQFYQKNKDPALLKEFYQSMIVPMANFMTSFVDSATGLPKPSYDLWEEKFLVSTFSTAATHGALLAAAELAEASDDTDNSVKWRLAAEEINFAAQKYLLDSDRKTFIKGVVVNGEEMTPDNTVDTSSLFGAFMFGLAPPDSDLLSATFDLTKSRLSSGEEQLDLARYENDNYLRKSADSRPNIWIITSLWAAQFQIEQGNKSEAFRILDWAKAQASPTGTFSEQLDPQTGERVSVEPLTWSHAEYVSTLLDTLAPTGDKS